MCSECESAQSISSCFKKPRHLKGIQWSMIRQGFCLIPHLKLAVSERCLSCNADEIWQTSPVISLLCLSDCHQRLSEKPSLWSTVIFQRYKNGCFHRSSKLLSFFLGFMTHSSLESIFFTAYEVCNQLLPFMIIPFILWSLLSLLVFFLYYRFFQHYIIEDAPLIQTKNICDIVLEELAWARTELCLLNQTSTFHI